MHSSPVELTEEGRAWLQRRVGLFGEVMFFIALVALVLQFPITPREDLLAPWFGAFVLYTLLAGAAWLGCRRGAHRYLRAGRGRLLPAHWFPRIHGQHVGRGVRSPPAHGARTAEPASRKGGRRRARRDPAHVSRQGRSRSPADGARARTQSGSGGMLDRVGRGTRRRLVGPTRRADPRAARSRAAVPHLAHDRAGPFAPH